MEPVLLAATVWVAINTPVDASFVPVPEAMKTSPPRPLAELPAVMETLLPSFVAGAFPTRSDTDPGLLPELDPVNKRRSPVLPDTPPPLNKDIDPDDVDEPADEITTEPDAAVAARPLETKMLPPAVDPEEATSEI